MRLIRVAVPVPQLDALTYEVPAALPQPALGARVLVPPCRRGLPGAARSSARSGRWGMPGAVGSSAGAEPASPDLGIVPPEDLTGEDRTDASSSGDQPA